MTQKKNSKRVSVTISIIISVVAIVVVTRSNRTYEETLVNTSEKIVSQEGSDITSNDEEMHQEEIPITTSLKKEKDATTQNVIEKPIKVFIMFGGINAYGGMTKEDVHAIYSENQKDLLVFTNGEFTPLVPNELYNGVEFSFLNHMKQRYPNERFGIIKITEEWAGIQNFLPESDEDFKLHHSERYFYGDFKNTLMAVLENEENSVEGIIWNQGAGDIANEYSAKNYENILDRLLITLREDLNDDELKVYIPTYFTTEELDNFVANHGYKGFDKYSYDILLAHNKVAHKDVYTSCVYHDFLPTYKETLLFNEEGMHTLGKLLADQVNIPK